MAKDPRVDAYIAKANDFAKPILKQIRAALHKGHPAVSETIKWGVPAYVDERGILCMTPAFKQHCAWVFWTGRKPATVDATQLRRITSIKDLRHRVSSSRSSKERQRVRRRRRRRRPSARRHP